MTWLVLLASVVLAGVAAAGILRPFGRVGEAGPEGPVDPLDDERQALLRDLRELERDRAGGVLAEAEYRGLRQETERRAVAVLRAIEARDGAGELVPGLREVRDVVSGNGRGGDQSARRPRRSPVRLAAMVALAAVAVGAVAVLLVGAVGNRTSGQPETGSGVGATAGSDPLAFFEQRVREHPNDVAARLDLATRYLQEGDVQDGIAQYLSALQLDPSNAEAHSNLGILLYRAGKPEEGLRAEEQALGTDPTYAEAYYFEGVILLEGLHRPADAAAAFRSYLRTAPFGAHRDEVQTKLLPKAEGQPVSPSPSP